MEVAETYVSVWVRPRVTEAACPVCSCSSGRVHSGYDRRLADATIGGRTRVKIVKNKVAAPFREAEVDIFYGKGISRESDILDLGVQQAVIEKSGSWYSYKGERIGQGRENARAFLLANPESCERLDAELRKRLGLDGANSADGDPSLAQDQLSLSKTARTA